MNIFELDTLKYDMSESTPVIPDADGYICNDYIPKYFIDQNKKPSDYYNQNMYWDAVVNNGKKPTDKFWVMKDYLHLRDVEDTSLFYTDWLEPPITDIPVLEKTISFNLLSNKERLQRLLTHQWVAGNITSDYFYTQGWDKDNPVNEHSFFNNDYTTPFLDEHIVAQDKTRSVWGYENFLEYFAPHVSASVFSIVNEPSFLELGSYFTEKTSHSIWACTIPISFSYGAYTDLERLGFDCFRDIVDTTSEYITDPIQRIQNSLDANKELLQNGLDVFNSSVQERLLENKHLLTSGHVHKNQIKLLNTESSIALFTELSYNNSMINWIMRYETSNTTR